MSLWGDRRNVGRARGEFHYFAGSFSGRSCAASRALRPKGRKGSEQFDGCRLPDRPLPHSWTKATKASGQGARLAESGQPIDSPMLPNPVSRLNVVRVSILREPGSLSLLCREETLLVFRDHVEPPGGFFTPISS